MVCCSPWGRKEPDMTEGPNSTSKVQEAKCCGVTYGEYEEDWEKGRCGDRRR